MIAQYKIIFTGSVGAGKTTAIATSSDIVPFSTEQTTTDEIKDKKTLATVAMDYSNIRLDKMLVQAPLYALNPGLRGEAT